MREKEKREKKIIAPSALLASFPSLTREGKLLHYFFEGGGKDFCQKKKAFSGGRGGRKNEALPKILMRKVYEAWDGPCFPSKSAFGPGCSCMVIQ